MKYIISYIAGLIFAIGLGISGMTQTHIVKGFLDVFGAWDFRLMGVMGGAIAIHALSYQLIKKKNHPVYAEKFFLPLNKNIDKNLLLGAAIFGLGWGWAGICPGPGIVSLVSGKVEFFVFVGAMVLGMYSFKFIKKS